MQVIVMLQTEHPKNPSVGFRFILPYVDASTFLVTSIFVLEVSSLWHMAAIVVRSSSMSGLAFEHLASSWLEILNSFLFAATHFVLIAALC